METPNPLASLTLVMWFLMFIPSYRMAQKAGFGWKMALLLSCPGLHFFILFVLAYKKWPNAPQDNLAEPIHQKNPPYGGFSWL